MSEMTNNSSLPQKWYDLQIYYDIRTILFSSTVNLLMCVVGTPGNFLVMTVYARKMTSSVRVYMFALSVADLITCVSVIVLSVAPIDHTVIVLLFYAGDISFAFSAFLLAFIAIERLLAVRRPFAFKCSAGRAKKTLVVITLSSVACAAILELARLLGYSLLRRVSLFVITLPPVSVMILCYVLMGVTMFKRKRAAHTTVSAEVVSQSSSASNGVKSLAISTILTDGTGHVPPNTVTQINIYKSVSLLFTITAVYILCWMPVWLHYAGLSVPWETYGVFLINAVVNPFIYSVVSAMFRSDVMIVYRQIRVKLTAWCQ